MLERFTVTEILIGINILVFLLETLAGGSTTNKVALRFGAQYSPYVRKGQYYRLVTAMFLHFGIYHLLANMYSLSVIGPTLESICGRERYLLIYLGSGLAGNLATWASDSIRRKNVISAGASGCIFGLLGACLVIALLTGSRYMLSTRSILTTLAINVIYGISSRRVNMAAHLGGLAGGMILMFLVLLFV
ncbi:MAG: rhomboid family intramembrane serine protease [Lachnospiraceae bacterium]|nr:rhomboid family intramembrane serine protease [Lachnospiraceae bacterium]